MIFTIMIIIMFIVLFRSIVMRFGKLQFNRDNRTKQEIDAEYRQRMAAEVKKYFGFEGEQK